MVCFSQVVATAKQSPLRYGNHIMEFGIPLTPRKRVEPTLQGQKAWLCLVLSLVTPLAFDTESQVSLRCALTPGALTSSAAGPF